MGLNDVGVFYVSRGQALRDLNDVGVSLCPKGLASLLRE